MLKLALAAATILAACAPAVAPLPATPNAIVPELRGLARAAYRAAHAGDCASVDAIDRAVRAADHRFHDVVFVHDDAIAACLARTAVAETIAITRK